MTQKDSPDRLQQESLLCRDCRLCCDGTLFEHAGITDGEEAQLQALPPDFNFVERKGGRAFLQCCPADAPDGCRIYSSRPAVCRHYACATLEDLREGKVSLAEARQRIDEILNQRAELVRACGVATTAEAYRLVTAAGRAARAPGERLPAYTLDLIVLQRLLDLYLRTADDAMTMGARSVIAGES